MMTWQLYRQLHAEGMDFEAGDMFKLRESLKAKPHPAKLPKAIEKLVRRYITTGVTFSGQSIAPAY